MTPVSLAIDPGFFRGLSARPRRKDSGAASFVSVPGDTTINGLIERAQNSTLKLHRLAKTRIRLSASVIRQESRGDCAQPQAAARILFFALFSSIRSPHLRFEFSFSLNFADILIYL